MDIFSKLIRIIAGNAEIRFWFFLGLIWLVLRLVCWLFGAIGLCKMGKAEQVYPRWFACIPGGQIYYTLRLAHKERLAHRAAWLFWWSLVLLAVGGVCLLWGAVYHMDGNQEFFARLLGILAAIAFLIALIFYIGLRWLEFQVLKKRLPGRKVFVACAIATIFFIPLQRIFLFKEAKNVNL